MGNIQRCMKAFNSTLAYTTHLVAFDPLVNCLVTVPGALLLGSVGTGEEVRSTGVTDLAGSLWDWAEVGLIPERRILSSNRLTSFADSWVTKVTCTCS